MKKLAILAILAISSICVMASVNIDSVVSRDTSADKNRVVISVSGDPHYSVQTASGGTVLRVVIPDAGSISGKPDYKRLSPVIDRISTYKDGGNAIVEIRTMNAVDVNHSLQDGKIVLNIGKTSGSPVVTQQEPSPKSAYLPQIEPKPSSRYYTSPQEIGTIHVKPAKKPIPKPLLPDSLTAASSREAKQLFPATSEIDSMAIPKAEEGDIPQKAPSKQGFGALVSKAGIPGLSAIILLILFVIVRAIGKKPTPKDDLKGTTLVLDDETKTRMVLKLLKEGWKASQIAKELNLPLREVEHTITQAQMSGGLDDNH